MHAIEILFGAILVCLIIWCFEYAKDLSQKSIEQSQENIKASLDIINLRGELEETKKTLEIYKEIVEAYNTTTVVQAYQTTEGGSDG